MLKLPQLNLAQKGLLIVVLPLVMQMFLYMQLKKQIDVVQQQAETQEYSRDVMVQVNAVILRSSQLFEAYVNLWVVRNNRLAAKTEPLTKEVRQQLDDLHQLLLTHPEDAESAQEIQEKGEAFIKELASVKLTLDEKGSPMSMWNALDMHRSFGATARSLNIALMKLGIDHIQRVRTAQGQELEARKHLLLLCDVAVILTVLMAVGLAMYFVKGTVSSLEILKNNARRLAANDALLAPITGGDEIAAVDKQFHEMARQLKEAAVQLDESYKRLQAVIDTVPIAIIICDEKGCVESVNQAGLQLFEYDAAELNTLPMSALLVNEKQGNVESLEKWLEETKDRPLQIEAQSKSKEAIPSELSVLRLLSPQGPRYLVTVTDITERFKMEKMKRDFLAMVSHDIRSPLTSINAGLDLIKSGADGEINKAVDSRVTDAQVSAQRLLNMVTKLLDLERLDSGVFNFELTDFAAVDALQSAWQAVKEQADAKGIKVHIPDSALKLHADRENVEHVVQNFFSNAVKFSPPNGVISCTTSEEGGMSKVCVSDQGSGVPDRYKDSIFERFKQAPQGRARKDGTGLGLSICRQIIQGLGGQIGVEDNAAGGSTFWFTLPGAESTSGASA